MALPRGVVSAAISASSSSHLSRHMTPLKLGEAVLELEDGHQVQQQKNGELSGMDSRAGVQGASWGRGDSG